MTTHAKGVAMQLAELFVKQLTAMAAYLKS
jgi:hypothetical protein